MLLLISNQSIHWCCCGYAKLLLCNIVGRIILWNIILSICLILPKSLTCLFIAVIYKYHWWDSIYRKWNRRFTGLSLLLLLFLLHWTTTLMRVCVYVFARWYIWCWCNCASNDEVMMIQDYALIVDINIIIISASLISQDLCCCNSWYDASLIGTDSTMLRFTISNFTAVVVPTHPLMMLLILASRWWVAKLLLCNIQFILWCCC